MAADETAIAVAGLNHWFGRGEARTGRTMDALLAA